jgi:hypothetical protein
LIYEWEKLLGEAIPNIDFLSVDTEGTELDVMKGFNIEKYQPKIIALENNFEDHNYRRTMYNYGYIFYERIGVNDYYMFTDYLPKLETGQLDLRDTPIVKRVKADNSGFKIFNK